MINLRRTIFCVTSLLLIFSFSCKSVPDNVEEGVSVETTPPIEQQAVQLTVFYVPLIRSSSLKGAIPNQVAPESTIARIVDVLQEMTIDALVD